MTTAVDAIPEPYFRFERGIATASWVGTPGVEMVFDRIREDRRTHDVTAELTTSLLKGDGPAVLHRGRLNVTSTRGKQEVAKYLGTLAPAPVWGSLLEQASWMVVDAVRQGRPAIRLADAPEPPNDGDLLPPLLSATDPTIIFGDGGSAKSYLGLALALSLHTGHPYAGLQPIRQVRVAYLDFEWNPWPHRRRMAAICGSDPLPDLIYVPCLAEGPLSGQVDRLRRILLEHAIKYVVLDSVALACAGPPEEAGTALDFFQALGQLEVGACLLAHVNRSGDEDRPFGSTFWHNSARQTWFVKATQEPNAARLDLALHNRKVNDGPRPASFALHFEFEPSRTMISRVDVRSIPELASGLPLKERIAGVLLSGATTVQDLAETLGVGTDTVSKTLRRSEGQRFVRLPDTRPDKWAVSAQFEMES